MNTQERATLYAAPAALFVGIVSIVGFIVLILFFGLEAPSVSSNPDGFHFWGFMSDVAQPIAMIPLIIVMAALHRVERPEAVTLSRVALMIGVIGALGVTMLQLLLIFRFLTFEQEVGPVVLAMGLTGVWLVLANYLALKQHILSAGLAWLGMTVGVAQALYPLLLQMLGGPNFYAELGSNYVAMAITAVIFLVSYIGFPTWAIWFSRRWAARPRMVKAGAAYAG